MPERRFSRAHRRRPTVRALLVRRRLRDRSRAPPTRAAAGCPGGDGRRQEGRTGARAVLVAAARRAARRPRPHADRAAGAGERVAAGARVRGGDDRLRDAVRRRRAREPAGTDGGADDGLDDGDAGARDPARSVPADRRRGVAAAARRLRARRGLLRRAGLPVRAGGRRRCASRGASRGPRARVALRADGAERERDRRRAADGGGLHARRPRGDRLERRAGLRPGLRGGAERARAPERAAPRAALPRRDAGPADQRALRARRPAAPDVRVRRARSSACASSRSSGSTRRRSASA